MRLPVPAAVLSVVLLLGACASQSSDSLGITTTSVSTTEPTPKPEPEPGTCTADDLEGAALEPAMLDERAGFSLQSDEVADTGPSDLAKAIRDDEQPDAATVLADLGFRRGYQRYWTNRAGNELVAFVYEFCDAESAAAYGERVFQIVPGLEPFEVVGAPGARGMSGSNGGALVAYATATYETTLVFTLARGAEGTVLLTEVRDRSTALLIDQVEALSQA